MLRLSVKGIEKLNAIADKYKFRNHYEIEQEEVLEFCTLFFRCINLGLNVDDEDYKFIIGIQEKLS